MKAEVSFDTKELFSLQQVERVTILLGIIFLAGTIFFWPTLESLFGLISGVVISLINFRLLRRGVARMFADEATTAGSGLRYGIKFIGFIGVVGFLILVVKINPIAFVVGFSTLILAIVYEGVQSLF